MSQRLVLWRASPRWTLHSCSGPPCQRPCSCRRCSSSPSTTPCHHLDPPSGMRWQHPSSPARMGGVGERPTPTRGGEGKGDAAGRRLCRTGRGERGLSDLWLLLLQHKSLVLLSINRVTITPEAQTLCNPLVSLGLCLHRPCSSCCCCRCWSCRGRCCGCHPLSPCLVTPTCTLLIAAISSSLPDVPLATSSLA